jgi:hypothetical protein
MLQLSFWFIYNISIGMTLQMSCLLKFTHEVCNHGISVVWGVFSCNLHSIDTMFLCLPSVMIIGKYCINKHTILLWLRKLSVQQTRYELHTLWAAKHFATNLWTHTSQNKWDIQIKKGVYNLKLSWQLNWIKCSQVIGRVRLLNGE